MQLQDQIAVVTGAAGVIGRSIAETFLREGAKVALLDRDQTMLDHAYESLIQGGVSEQNFVCIPCDVSQPDDVARAFEVVDRALGTCDVVAAIAGIAKSELFLEMTVETWQDTLNVNLSGVFYTCQQAARRMMTKRRGSIITMSSTNGIAAEENLSAYDASKAGVLLLTKSIAIELAPYGIRANSLNPGAIDTGLAQRSGLPAEATARYISDIPMGRLGRPEEVAAAALFLASESASFITGLALVVDGGQLSQQ